MADELEKLIADRADLDAKIRAAKAKREKENACDRKFGGGRCISGANSTAPEADKKARTGAAAWAKEGKVKCILPKGHVNFCRSTRHEDGSYLVW